MPKAATVIGVIIMIIGLATMIALPVVGSVKYSPKYEKGVLIVKGDFSIQLGLILGGIFGGFFIIYIGAAIMLVPSSNEN